MQSKEGGYRRVSNSAAPTNDDYESGLNNSDERPHDDHPQPFCVRRRGLIFAVVGAGLGILFAALLIVLLLGALPLADVSSSKEHTPRGRFFQLSDLHYDPLYRAEYNSSSRCRAISPFTGQPAQPVGASSANNTWGQYGCDPPLRLIESALDAMLQIDSAPDFIVVSGDFVGHRLHKIEIANESITAVSKLIKQKFPNTVILPAIGNNDVYPDYHLPYGPTAWISYLTQLWSSWLSSEQQATFGSGGGYYSAKIPNTRLRAIVLNTVFYSTDFVPSNATSIPLSFTWDPPPADDLPDDPDGQFAWLADQLEQASHNSERVIIVGHIPYGVNEFDGKPLWHEQYTKKYISLVAQYNRIIGNQLFAHFHTDEFRVLYRNDLPPSTSPGPRQLGRDAISSTIIHPSISPLHANNPSFRYYHYHRATGEITDYSHFYADLFYANYYGTPKWTLEYTFDAAFDATAVDTAGFAHAAELVVQSATYAARFDEHKNARFLRDDPRQLFCALGVADNDQYTACLQNAGLERRKRAQYGRPLTAG